MDGLNQIIAIDIGTTSTKALAYDVDRGIIGWAVESYPTYYPRPGFVEQNPDEVLTSVVRVIASILKLEGADAGSVAAVVLAGVWQSMIPVDHQGRPLARAMTWADSRALIENERLAEILPSEEIRSRTGCTLHPMYFPARLHWYRNQAPDIHKKTFKYISIKEYVLYHLFGEFMVDKSIASGTGILNMFSVDWDNQILDRLNVSQELFSQVAEPTEMVGGLRKKMASATGLPAGTPAVLGAADGALAHLGSVGLSTNRMSLTVGTGAALRKLSRKPAVQNDSTSWCYYLVENHWLNGGVLQDAGNSLKWFADNFLKNDYPEDLIFEACNDLADDVAPGADGLLFLPLMSGERCPNHNPDARGSIYGLSLSHEKRHLVRALMEGLAFRFWSVYRMLADDSDPELVVTGGLLKSQAWLKIIADFFGKPLHKPQIEEASAWGALLIGLKALGVIDSIEQVDDWIKLSICQSPDAESHESYRRVRRAYQDLYAKLF